MTIGKAGLVIAFFLVPLLPVMGQGPEMSQSITIMTDKSTYTDGDKIMISGTVTELLNVPMSIVIKDPNQKIVLIAQTNADNKNTYSTQITAGGSLWTTTGSYEIDVTYGSKDNTAKTTFEYAVSHVFPVNIAGSKYNATYTITNGEITSIMPDTASKSILISLHPAGNGVISITLPRTLIDSKADSQDSQFVVNEDSAIISVNETKTEVDRTLTIPFLSTTKQIEITGTQIIPEFGPFVSVVLCISIAAIVFFVKFRTKSSILSV